MLIIEEIQARHDRSSFDCGVQPLNDYLSKNARQQTSRGIARTYVLIDDDMPNRVMGFYTLCFAEVFPPTQSKLAGYPHKLVGLKIARLAVDINFQKMGFGSYLIMEIFKNAITIQDVSPMIGILVDAKDDVVKQFYEEFGFEEIESDLPLTLFLPIATCRATLASLL